MYLLLKGKPIHPNASLFSTTEDDKPGHLVPLGKSLWPKEQVARLVTLFKNAGIPEPLTQKLVEPYAYYFGGRDDGGVPDLSQVDWEKMLAYFEWEIAAILEDERDKARAMQDSADEKYGHIFWHYDVWMDRSQSYY